MQKSKDIAKNLWAKKGIRHAAQGRHDKAIACFDHALEIDPLDGFALFNKAYSLSVSGHPEESLSWYDQCLAIYPQYYLAWCNKGWDLYLLGRYAEAIESLDRGLALNRYDAALLYNKACAEDALGHESEAAHYYRRFLYNAEPDMVKEVKEVHQRMNELNKPITLMDDFPGECHAEISDNSQNTLAQ
ncbi:MAG: tetratricopeptide repeat protein [Anaerolineae bacterium]